MTTTSDIPELDIRETMFKLHAELAKYFLTLVESPESEHKASLYSVIAQFLKDNKITLDSINAFQLSTGLRKFNVIQGGETKDNLSLPFNLDS